ncbi:aminopeptidase [Empedobacter falsenii]|uniref:aminopeptidase C n=1 Tax=Empedobacter falsenii TaxID=343874 RepID=UPI002577CBCE|nr:C1 family peptidase [Empedobacter falsenii]MDM1297802.1 aminopeptidase [Empedobacter falsenii]MDM1317568.1 aminopeptidase [Empedobacter falsenii]
MRKIFYPVLASALFLASAQLVSAQDNLVNSLNKNVSENSKEAFKFTDVINLAKTPVENQGSSGTCWSYSGNSFFESEMLRMGKQPIQLSPIFNARNTYVEKGKQYVRMHGATTLGDGGSFYDVLNTIKKYGAVPTETYTGLNYGTKTNQFGEMAAIQEGVLKAVVANPNGKLTPNWEKAYTAVLDSYLGEYPKEFTYNGKKYTPRTFADQVVGINPNDYVAITSFKDHDYYKPFVLAIPDNWAYESFYNVPMTEMTDNIDYALKNGFTVAWATDVSEKGFSWKNGVAYVPEVDFADMNAQQKADMFKGPKPEKVITEDMRQAAFDDYQTTDDHGMHIVGIAKDQNGKDYYIVKNSWGLTNDYEGYLYVTKAFVQYKTTNILIHKNGVQKQTLKKLEI